MHKRPELDVAVPGVGIGGANAHDHEARLALGIVEGQRDIAGESVEIADQMVGRDDAHNRFGAVAAGEHGGGEGEAGGGIAGHGLRQEILGGKVGQERAQRRHERGAGHNVDVTALDDARGALDGFLEHRAAARESQHLLGAQAAAQRPERSPDPPAMMTTTRMRQPPWPGSLQAARVSGGVSDTYPA